MPTETIINDDTLLPGDVVIDEPTHRPMQVTGYDPRNADAVPDVWDNRVNQHYYGLDPEAAVVEAIAIPTGDRYYIPANTDPYPACRLKRVLTEPATDERRPQAKVIRSVLAHLVADARDRGHDRVADAILTLSRGHFTDAFVSEVDEFADTADMAVAPPTGYRA